MRKALQAAGFEKVEFVRDKFFVLSAERRRDRESRAH